MKNVLITIFTLLIAILAIVFMVNGFTIGNFKILSVAQIKESSEELDAEIEKLNELKNTTYKTKVSNLETSTKALTTSKQKYLDLASVCTDAEIKAATVTQKYSMEYLWSKLGGYATKEGVNLKIVVQTSGVEDKNTIDFTLVGSYISIINYVSAIENDSDLGFRIENFKISGSSEQLTATFKVTNVGIKSESVSTQVSSGTSSVLNTTQSTSQTTTATQDSTISQTGNSSNNTDTTKKEESTNTNSTSNTADTSNTTTSSTNNITSTSNTVSNTTAAEEIDKAVNN